MALGDTPMSSSTIFTNPTATSGSDGGNNVMAQRGANYFFGFLITFVVLFLIFVGCGIGSRRRLLAERREAGLLTEWGTPWSDVDQKRPAFHEFALGVPVRVDQWEYIMPLSAMLWRHPPKEPPDAEVGADPGTYSPSRSDLEAARGGSMSPYHIFSGFPLPHWRSTRSNDKKPPEPDEKTDELLEEMSITVMIAMPCSANANHRRSTFEGTDIAPLTECQIGTTVVPWPCEVSSGALPPVPPRTPTTPQNL